MTESLEEQVRRISAANQQSRLTAERRSARILSTFKPDGPTLAEVADEFISETFRGLEGEDGGAHGGTGEN